MLQSQALLQNPKVQVGLLALDRVSDQVVVARLRVVNQGDEEFDFGNTVAGSSRDSGAAGTFDTTSFSAISLFDGVNSRRHFPLNGTDNNCLCTRYLGNPKVPAGQSYDVVAAFPAPPTAVGSLDVLFPDAPPFLDVPVGRRPGQTIAVDSDNPTLDPTKVRAARPRVLQVISTVENATGAEDDTGGDLSIRISTDVLFALNKADLSPRAQAILRDVAGKVDNSPGNTVRIDGYTDNSGNDEINNPLSERRARSVENALKGLVTRSGVGYQSKGHGSADPVASNDSARGRQLNRRVTVTFARPKVAGSSSPAVSASAGAPQLTVRSAAKPDHYNSDWPGPGKASARIDALHRDRDGYAVLKWTVHNDDSAVMDISTLFTSSDGLYWGSSTGLVTLAAGDRRYRALRDSEGSCLGPDFSVMHPGIYQVGKGEELTMTAMFKLPADLQSVTVDIPGFDKSENVPVQ